MSLTDQELVNVLLSVAEDIEHKRPLTSQALEQAANRIQHSNVMDLQIACQIVADQAEALIDVEYPKARPQFKAEVLGKLLTLPESAKLVEAQYREDDDD